MTIFDRSWYGRVLVERVEGFATEAEWMRAYAEINQFEEQLVAHGIVLVKFWIHITQGRAARRFKERETRRYKRWKITDEDWRNREAVGRLRAAVNDMVERTSTRSRPVDARRGQRQELRAAEGLKRSVTEPGGAPCVTLNGVGRSRWRPLHTLTNPPPDNCLRRAARRRTHEKCPARLEQGPGGMICGEDAAHTRWAQGGWPLRSAQTW